MRRDPFRPADPWKAEWDMHTEPYRGDRRRRLRASVLELLVIWGGAIALLVALSFFVSTQAIGVIAAIVIIALLVTVRV